MIWNVKDQLQADLWSPTTAWQDIEVWKERGEEDLRVFASCTVENSVMTGQNVGSTDMQRGCNFTEGICSILTWAVALSAKTLSVLGFPGDL